jgi:transposase
LVIVRFLREPVGGSLRLPRWQVHVSGSESSAQDAVVERLLADLEERDRLIAALTERVEVLTARVAELEARLGKNSQNSSKPPSSDNPFTKPPPRSLRGKSGRRPGKQSGDPGARLEPRPDPDQVVVHTPQRCAGCGGDLVEAPVVAEERRQVFDLPAVRLQVVEHRTQRRVCACGQATAAGFPAEASAPTCYGPGVAALGTYLLARQHLPVARAAELLADCLGAPVSTGWLAGLPSAAADRLAPFTAEVRDRLRESPVAHFDETGARVAGKLWWIHVACTDTLTLYHRAPSRGEKSMNLGGVLPEFTGVAVHDGLTSYRRYDITHGLCNAHHLRELTVLVETIGNNGVEWPAKMAHLLVQMHTAVQNAKAAGLTALDAQQLADYQDRYRALIGEAWAAHPPPPPTGKRGRPRLGTPGSLVRRLDLYQNDVLRFATDFAVPFDNNQAERDIRMIRLQQKISTSWRSEHGIDAFLAVRSYLSTARKRGKSALDVLRELFTAQPWLPAPAT